MTRLTAISVLLYAQSCVAAVWFVDKDNTGIEDGMSWATAFSTIQPAIDAASADAGGEVWVAEGVYDEARSSLVHSPPVETGSLLLKDDVQLFGGFVGNETIRDERDFENNLTVIDGSTSRSGSPAFHVIFGADNAVVDGFTVTGGVGESGPPSLTQGGAGMFNDSGNVQIRNCIFTENMTQVGGGIFTFQHMTIDLTTFSNNSAEDGGAIRGTTETVINSCVFQNNQASARGGAIFISGDLNSCIFINNTANAGGAVRGSGDINSCVFRGNSDTGTSVGGAGAITAGNNRIINSIFDSNSSADVAGAIRSAGIIGMDGSSTTNIEIINCAFWNNTAGPGGAAVHLTSVDGFIRNSIFWNNSPNQIVHLDPGAVLVQFNDIQGGEIIFGGIPFEVAGQVGNIDAEPFFVDPQNGDFRVFTGSPVIDAGTATGAPATDINGIARPQGAGFDMGAHESDGSLPSIPAAQTAALITLTALCALAACRYLMAAGGCGPMPCGVRWPKWLLAIRARCRTRLEKV